MCMVNKEKYSEILGCFKKDVLVVPISNMVDKICKTADQTIQRLSR